MPRITMRSFTSPDGVRWGVEVPKATIGASNAMIVFHHPDGRTARRDRYAWVTVDSPVARDVTARLDPGAVLDSLDDQQLARLFRRSMLISAADSPLAPPVTHLG